MFGGTRRSVEAARAKLEASVEDLRATLLTLLGDVAKNYTDLRANQAQREITRRNVEAQQQTVEVTRERFRLGLTSYLDVAQAEAQKATTESNLPTLEASIKQSIHRLGILLGKEPNALKAELSAIRPLPQPNGVMATGLPSDLLTRRPDLRQVERQLAAASADIGVATAELYPKFDLTAALGLQGSTVSKFLNISSGRYWSLVPGVTWNLFDGGKARATVNNKRAVYEENLAKYRASFLTALEEVENALAAYYAEQTKRRILAESVRANEEAVALANERYRRGLTNFLDVLTARKFPLHRPKQPEQVGGESPHRSHLPVQGPGRRLGCGRCQGGGGPGYTGDEALRKFPGSKPELRVARIFGQTGNNRKPGA